MSNNNITQYLANKKIENARRRNELALRREQTMYERAEQERAEQEAAQINNQMAAEAKSNDAGFFKKLGATLGDVFGELGGGLFKLGEGLTDAFLSIQNAPVVGGGWWLEKLLGKENMLEDAIKFDATQEWWYSWEDKLTKDSYLNDAPMVKEIVRGIGQQLPTIGAIAAAPVTGGATLALIPALQGMQAISAGGQGVEEALNDDATFVKALSYGVMQGGMEYLLEKIPLGTGKIASTVVKEGAQGAARTVGKSVAKNVLEESLQEAIQEGLSALANPVMQTVYKGTDALEQYKNPEFYKDAGYQALVGGITGGLTAGASQGLAVRNAGGKSSYLIQQSASELAALDEKQSNLYYNDTKYTKKAYDELNTARAYEQENITKNQETLSPQLKSMTEEKRAKIIERYGLSEYFTAEGDIIPQTANNKRDGQTIREDNKPLVEPNFKAYDPKLKNEIDTLDYAPTSGEVSQAATEGKRVIHSLPGIAKNMHVVITDTNQTETGERFTAAKGKSADGRNIIYISNDATMDEIYADATIHELTHTLEGSDAYEEFADLILNDKYAMRDDKGNFVKGENGDMLYSGQYEKDIAAKTRLYKNVNKNAKNGKTDAAKKTAKYEAATELIAARAGEVLGNEKSIRRITATNKNAARRIWVWLSDTISRIGDKNKNYTTFLRKAEKLYGKALQEAYGGIPLKQIRAMYDEEEKQGKEQDKTDNEKTSTKTAEVRYSLDKSFSQQVDDVLSGKDKGFNHLRLGNTPSLLQKAGINDLPLLMTKKHLETIINDSGNDKNANYHGLGVENVKKLPELIANPVMLMNSLTRSDSIVVLTEITDKENRPVIAAILINGSGMQNDVLIDANIMTSAYGRNGFENFINKNLTAENVFYWNKEKSANLFKSLGLQLPNGLNDLHSNTIIRKWNENVNRNTEKRFSLKEIDSKGRQLSQEQIEFFKDSKVRDSEGRLLEVYHGTGTAINTFNPNLTGQGNDQFGSGFYFTSDFITAEGYTTRRINDKTKLGGEDNPNVVASYLNIANPIKIDGMKYSNLDHIEVTANQAYKIFKQYPDILSAEDSPLGDYFDDFWDNGADDNMLRRLSHYSKWDLGGIDYFFKNHPTVFRNAIKQVLGYDGVIVDFNDSSHYVAWFNTQIKSVDNKTPTSNPDIRYSLKETNTSDLDNMTESTYNKYGWASANKVLSKSEVSTFLKKVGERKNGVKFNKSADGKYIIEVGDKFGINNVLVYTKGDYESPSIDKIVKINLYDETTIAPIRSEIYEYEKRGFSISETSRFIAYYAGEIILSYEATDFSTFRELQRQRKSSGVSNSDSGNNNRRSGNAEKDSGDKQRDLRYALKDDKGGYNYSAGQIAKYVANNSKAKAYARTDSAKIIDGVVNNTLTFGDKYGEIKSKTRNQLIDKLFHDLNTKDEGYRTSVALDIAEAIINNAVVTDVYSDAGAEATAYLIGQLKPYLRSVDLSSIKGEIQHRYGNDRSPYQRWGKRKDVKGQSADQIAMELEGNGIRFKSSNETDIFFEMDDMYRSAQETLKKLERESKQALKDFATAEELTELKQAIAREVLIGYGETGFKTKFQKAVERYTNKISALKETLREVKAWNKAKDNLFATIERVKKYKDYTNKAAGVELPSQMVKFVDEILKIKTWRGNLSPDIKKELSKLNKIYEDIFTKEEAKNNPYFETSREIELKMDNLTAIEVRQLDTVLQNFIKEVKEYDTVRLNGRSESETTIAEKGVFQATKIQKIRTKHFGLSVGIRRFIESTYNPYTKFSSIFGYIGKDSIMERLFNDIMDGNRKRAVFVQKSNKLFDKYFESKTFIDGIKKSVTLEGDGTTVTMSRAEMLSLYLTMQREQGLAHINNAGRVKLLNPELVKKNDIKGAQIRGQEVRIDEAMLESIKNQLTESETEFLKAAREFFDVAAKDAKVETDMILHGVTNALEKMYYPIKTADSEIYKEVGTNTDVMQTVRNFGYNMDTVPNPQSIIVIESVFDVIARHISGMSIYHGYAVPISTYNRIINKKTESGTLRNEIAKIDPKFSDYVNQLFLDMQGIGQGEIGMADRTIGFLRRNLARAALALNPKVLLSQTASLASALTEFNPKYVAKGMPGFFSKQAMQDVLEYSPLMAERNDLIGNIDAAELRANTNKMQGAKQTVNKVLDAPLKGIEFMDSHVIAAIWQAAINEQADILGKSKDSVEVKEAAARRTEEVVFKSQQTSDALGRSSFMRSKSQLVKLFSMFKGDAIQLASQFLSSIDKILTYKKMLKSGDTDLIKIAKENMSTAKKAFAKSGTAVFMNVTWLTLIAIAMKAIKGFKDDEKVSEFALNEAIANIMGLLPLGSELHSLFSGYDLDNPAYSALSTLVDTAKNIYSSSSTLIKGDAVDEVATRAAWRKTSLGLAQILGVPLRNVESYGMGIVGHVSPSTKAEYDALFKTKSNTAYLTAITNAIEKGDAKAADTYLNIMFDSRTGKIKDDKVLKTMRDLIEEGHTNILPKSLGKEIIYNNEKISLTKKQQTAFEKIYSQANEKVKTMINTKLFATLDDTAKAKAIKIIYDFYWNLGLEDLLGEDLENKNILFSKAIPIEQLAMVSAQAGLYEADLDKSGKSITGSRKTKITQFINKLNLPAAQKYMIMGYLGYTNKNGTKQVKAYINSMKLSKTQKESLYEMSGY